LEKNNDLAEQHQAAYIYLSIYLYIYISLRCCRTTKLSIEAPLDVTVSCNFFPGVSVRLSEVVFDTLRSDKNCLRGQLVVRQKARKT